MKIAIVPAATLSQKDLRPTTYVLGSQDLAEEQARAALETCFDATITLPRCTVQGLLRVCDDYKVLEKKVEAIKEVFRENFAVRRPRR